MASFGWGWVFWKGYIFGHTELTPLWLTKLKSEMQKRKKTAFCREQKNVLCVYRSDYRKSLPGDFIRIRLKIEQKCHLFWDIFVSAIMNDLFMTFTSRLKVDAKCVHQQWNWITVANSFGTPTADWVHGYLYFEPGAWIWTKGSDVTCKLWKTDLETCL